MIKKTTFIGIDIASKTFVSTIFNSKKSITEEFDNNLEGYNYFVCWLKKHRVKTNSSIVIMEATGVYTEELCHYLYKNEYDVCVENPLKVKRAFGISPKKTDIIDSKRIAEYGFRFLDQIKLWQPPQEIIEEIKELLSLRENLVKQNTANKNRLKALKKKVIQNKLSVKLIKELIEMIESKIKEIINELKRLVIINKEIGFNYINLISIPGVSLLLASEIIGLTDNFNKTKDPREIASYLGISPNEHSSGTMTKKPKSAGYGHSRIRKLLYLASCSIKNHNKEFRNYFNRKVLSGKHKGLVLNNISNKIIKIMCGIANSGKPFIQGYVSLSPSLVA
jgi:transposase